MTNDAVKVMTKEQEQVLSTLRGFPYVGLTPTQIAESCGHPNASNWAMSALKSLIKAGWVRRTVSASPRRVLYVTPAK